MTSRIAECLDSSVDRVRFARAFKQELARDVHYGFSAANALPQQAVYAALGACEVPRAVQEDTLAKFLDEGILVRDIALTVPSGIGPMYFLGR